MKQEVKDLNAPSRWNMRIWDDDKKEWLCQSNQECLTYYGFDITGGETTEFQGLPKLHPDRHLVWEQSTGLKDKNGKEIYEGDIVKQVWGEYCNLWKIVWNNKGFARFMLYGISGPIKGECDIAPSDEFEVIGNIHENPELLKGGKNEIHE